MAKATGSLRLSYEKLVAKYKDLMILRSAESIVDWDMETKMPPRGIVLRSQQLAMLTQIEHKISTDPEIGTLLKKVERNSRYENLNQFQKRNVHLIRKNYDEQTKLPEKLVVEIERQRAITIDVWKKAKSAKNFPMFKPELEKLYALRKQAAEILMKVKNTKSSYDALIDTFEPKMTSHMIAKTFDKLRTGLISILKKCESASRQPDPTILRRKIPINVQREISNSLAEFIGYDVQSKNAGGRIDETEHPFTTGYFDDVRITTHYYEDRFSSSVFSILHEGGHALYGQNMNHDWMYQPIGASCSYGFSESQSRFVENMIGRSKEFWTYYLPKLKAIVGKTFSDVNLDSFIHAINQVTPSKIRVEADEVTYCLHIIIRFEIEHDLFADKISIAELPEIWNQKYTDYLGLEIKNDSEGVMQDTHWASGYFGYFPSYALGNIYSGQILFTMQRDIPNWGSLLKKGDFHSIKQWLTENVYSQGKIYDPMDLLKKITGEEINVKHYIDYLDTKFSELYGF